MSEHGPCFRCGAEISSDYLYGGKMVGAYVDFNKKNTGRFRLPLCCECISVLTENEHEGGPDIEDLGDLV